MNWQLLFDSFKSVAKPSLLTAVIGIIGIGIGLKILDPSCQLMPFIQHIIVYIGVFIMIRTSMKYEEKS